MAPGSIDRRHSRRGFTLVATAIALFVLIGMLGLAFDIGRAFIVKGEVQTFVDSAALDAVLELDGTQAGLGRARSRVAGNANRWDFYTKSFSSVNVAFSQNPAGPWEEFPLDAVSFRLARVTASTNLPLMFLPAALSAPVNGNAPAAFFIVGTTMTINADSAGGQEPKTTFRDGLLPFSPFAHNPNLGPHYGLTVGQQYTLRWASSPRTNGGNVCAGDRVQSVIDLASAGGGEERGFIEESSASMIRDTIIYSYQTISRQVGDSVVMTGGAKQTMVDALLERVNQDSDAVAATFNSYVSRNLGNGRRVVGVPVNTGYPNYRVVLIGAFFLLAPSEYQNGGNKPLCAEYIGSWVQGSKNRGASPAGAYYTRLVQ